MTKLTIEEWNIPFSLTTVCREDLKEHYTEEQIASLDDSDMAELAEKMGESYMNYFWDDMQIIVDSILEDKVRQFSL